MVETGREPNLPGSRAWTFSHYSRLSFSLSANSTILYKKIIPADSFREDSIFISQSVLTTQRREHFVILDADGVGYLQGHVTNAETEGPALRRGSPAWGAMLCGRHLEILKFVFNLHFF